ncbi:hypothetical protein ABPG72_021329 [Tetrahymena utriculariae]
MIDSQFKKKIQNVDDDPQQQNRAFGMKQINLEKNQKDQEKSLTIKYYAFTFFWIQILFLSFILNSNYIGDYNNFINDHQVVNDGLQNQSQFDTLFAKSIAVLSFTIVVEIISLFEIIAVHMLSQNIVKIFSILTIFFYLVRFSLGVAFLADEQKQGILNQKTQIDKIKQSQPSYCYDGQPSEVKQCKYIYSFNFFYGQEIFLLIVASLLIVPQLIYSFQFKNLKIEQILRKNMESVQSMQQNQQIILQDLNETRDYLKQDYQQQNTSILYDNFAIKQRNIQQEKDEINQYCDQYIQNKQKGPKM